MSVSPYRKTMIIGSRRILIFLLLAALLNVPGFGQRPNRRDRDAASDSNPDAKKDQPRGPRAIAVLDWTAKGPRLIPVAIKVGDQFYDASLYMAQPVPMAIDSGVIYQVQQAGEPLGDFTLNEAEQSPSGLWVGLGKFDSEQAQEKRQAQVTKRFEAAAKQKAAEEKQEEGDRPVLKRATPKTSEPPEQTSAPPPSTPPASTPAPTSTSTSTSPTQTSSASAPAQAASTTLADTDNAPDRPILRRGNPMRDQAESFGNEAPAKDASAKTASAKETPAKKPVTPPAGLNKVEVAVSDATTGQVHPYKWTWANPEEEQKLHQQAEDLAMKTLADYRTKIGGPMPGKLEDVKFDTYDLTYSNAPTVILSARVLPAVPKPAPTKRGARTKKAAGASSAASSAAPAASSSAAAPGFEYYVTIVGREDIYGQLQKEFVVASDNKHLDAFPKMQLIGVVDVDGNGSGSMLFQSSSDLSNSFVIYRDLGWSLQEVIKVPEPKV